MATRSGCPSSLCGSSTSSGLSSRPNHAYAAVVPAFLSCALSGQALPVNGDGTQTRDFTYVGTVAAVLTDALRRRVTASEPVNLAYGSRVSLLELIGTMEDVIGHPLRRDHFHHRGRRRPLPSRPYPVEPIVPRDSPDPFGRRPAGHSGMVSREPLTVRPSAGVTRPWRQVAIGLTALMVTAVVATYVHIRPGPNPIDHLGFVVIGI